MNEEIMNNDEMELDNEEFEETTDLVPSDGDDDSDGISAGEIAIGGLALVGAGFLLKKTWDLGKLGVEKAKSGIENWKQKRAEKKAAKAEDPANEDIVDGEATVEDVPEEEPKKAKGSKK